MKKSQIFKEKIGIKIQVFYENYVVLLKIYEILSNNGNIMVI